MFANITAAIAQTFNAVTTLASAAEKLAKTADNLATVGVETSGIYVDNARSDREIAQIERKARYEAAKAKALSAAKSTALTAPIDVEAK